MNVTASKSYRNLVNSFKICNTGQGISVSEVGSTHYVTSVTLDIIVTTKFLL
jgi:hypothetical protein